MNNRITQPKDTMVRIGASSCLLGHPVRYDGIDQRDPFIAGILGQFCEMIPVCPEEECGLGVPREIMRLVGTASEPSLVTVKTGTDLTARMQAWCREKMVWLAQREIDGVICKSRSPSCGLGQVKIYPTVEGGEAQRIGTGLFARAVMDYFPVLPTTDERTLQDHRQRENFIERIFCIKRWRQTRMHSMTAQGLIDFHSVNKFQVLAHSEPHYRSLGRIAAQAKDKPIPERFAEYECILTEALRILPTPAKHTNVLQHLAGYFKKMLSPTEKEELFALIDQYRQGKIPLLAPITLINHYADQYGQEYLVRQYYLRPDPAETMLRYHA